MIVTVVSQPGQQLGTEITELLDSEVTYSRIALISAFAGLRTVLRLRDRLLMHAEGGTDVAITVGIDFGGTSREVLEELLQWNCRTFVFHNPVARATFHPKVYLFESPTSATLFIGSNNLTDGGLYTNYEAAARYSFDLPSDEGQYKETISQLGQFLNPQGGTVRQLDAHLLETMVARGALPSEAQARKNRGRKAPVHQGDTSSLPVNPFSAVAVALPPLLPENVRGLDVGVDSEEEQPATGGMVPSSRVLVWTKRLTRSDALQVREGTAHVGGVRLTQAGFEYPAGQPIDQTTYFRRLFVEYHWEREGGRRRRDDQEHTFVPIRMVIRGLDYGVRRFEISHKPAGEAGQNNYTTILRWGREFNQIVAQQNISGATFSLFSTDSETEPFLIEIAD